MLISFYTNRKVEDVLVSVDNNVIAGDFEPLNAKGRTMGLAIKRLR